MFNPHFPLTLFSFPLRFILCFFFFFSCQILPCVFLLVCVASLFFVFFLVSHTCVFKHVAPYLTMHVLCGNTSIVTILSFFFLRCYFNKNFEIYLSKKKIKNKTPRRYEYRTSGFLPKRMCVYGGGGGVQNALDHHEISLLNVRQTLNWVA